MQLDTADAHFTLNTTPPITHWDIFILMTYLRKQGKVQFWY